MTEPINRFRGAYQFLSNFYPALIQFEGFTYQSVEHAYQASKTLDLRQRRLIRAIKKAGAAKYVGRRQITLRPDWEDVKLDIMLDLLRKKFAHGILHDWLIETGDAELIEGNHWGDFFWGVCEGVGQNHLGKLLMQVRKEIS
jgi:N-glycosidase YbiA